MALVDNSSPAEIANAIDTVNQTPGLRIKPGYDALIALFQAPAHSLPLKTLQQKYRGLNAQFGWFCGHVARQLGESAPDRFALVNYSKSDSGAQLLTLKPAVVAALATNRMSSRRAT